MSYYWSLRNLDIADSNARHVRVCGQLCAFRHTSLANNPPSHSFPPNLTHIFILFLSPHAPCLQTLPSLHTRASYPPQFSYPSLLSSNSSYPSLLTSPAQSSHLSTIKVYYSASNPPQFILTPSPVPHTLPISQPPTFPLSSSQFSHQSFYCDCVRRVKIDFGYSLNPRSVRCLCHPNKSSYNPVSLYSPVRAPANPSRKLCLTSELLTAA